MNKQILELAKEAGAVAYSPPMTRNVIGYSFTFEQLTKFAELLLAKSVPDGYVLVPIEPTPKMVDATFNDIEERHTFIESHNKRNKRIYKAMLSAAPAQPQQTDRIAELEYAKSRLLGAIKHIRKNSNIHENDYNALTELIAEMESK